MVRRCSGGVPIVLGNRARGGRGPIVGRDGADVADRGADDAQDSILRNPSYNDASLV